MSDEKDTGTEDWRIDSLEEDDEIIDLTDEVVPPPRAAVSVDAEAAEIEELDITELEEEPLELTDEVEEETDFDSLLTTAVDDMGVSEIEEEPLELTNEVEEETDLEDLSALVADEMTVSEIEEEPLELTDEVEEETDLEDLQASADDGMMESEEEAEIDPAEVDDIDPFPDTPPVDSDPEREWQEVLAAELNETLTPADDEIIEISEFDQEYFSADEAAEATAGLTGTSPAEDDDYLELIDIEEPEEDSTELDDDIIRFESEEAESESIVFEEVKPENSFVELENDSGESTDDGLPTGLRSAISPGGSLQAADDHWLEEADLTGPDKPADELATTEEPVFVTDADDADAGTADEDLETAEDIDESQAAALGAVGPSQIEAAVARIIQRDYAGKIEGLVAAAIEKVVSEEIRRLKSKLFEEGEDDTR